MNSVTEAIIMLMYNTFIWVQKTCVGLFNMACVILNQRYNDRAIKYFAMVIWCLAMMVITTTIVMVLLAIIMLAASTILYLVFGVVMPGQKVFIIY